MRRFSVAALMIMVAAAHSAAATPRTRTTTTPPPAPAAGQKNPLLPPQIPLDSFFIDLSLTQKSPAPPVDNFEPLYTADDWQTYRTRFGEEADTLAKKKSSGLIEFSEKLIKAAGEPAITPGLKRLLLLRAAIDCYRTREGFNTANKAVLAYQSAMDIHSPTQIGALWTIANVMSRTITTPKPSRIHYSAIAARANMQLTILLFDNDQLEPAESLQKIVGYHEGWLHTAGASAEDKVAYGQIPHVRALVKQTQSTMDYLATQYQPAISGDDNALMAIYLYGRYVKQKPQLVADLPGRKPSSPMAQLAAALDAVDRKTDPVAPYTAAETLKIVASTLPDGVLKQRTLYAALQNYRLFIQDPRTERERVKRTLARMAMESVIADGAHGPSPVVNPFAPPTPATAPSAATQPGPMPSLDSADTDVDTSPHSTTRPAPPTSRPAAIPLPDAGRLTPSTPTMPDPDSH